MFDLTNKIRSFENEGADCTPMEGDEPEALNKILDLHEKGLHSTLIFPLGYYNADKN